MYKNIIAVFPVHWEEEPYKKGTVLVYFYQRLFVFVFLTAKHFGWKNI